MEKKWRSSIAISSGLSSDLPSFILQGANWFHVFLDWQPWMVTRSPWLFHSTPEGRKYTVRPRPIAWHWWLNGSILSNQFRKKYNGFCIILVENPSQTKISIKKDASGLHLEKCMRRRCWSAARHTFWSFWEVTRLSACPMPLTFPSWSLEIHSLGIKKNVESLFMNVMA